MLLHFFITAFIWLFVCVPLMLVSVPVVALLLLTKWDGRTTWFGNSKHGRATNHFDHPTKGSYWLEFNWLVLRNPINNFAGHVLAAAMRDYDVWGDEPIGDKVAGGFYGVKMGPYWEYYWIKPYTIFGSRRCVRARIGWKINGTTTPEASFVFVLNPWKTYRGT